MRPNVQFYLRIHRAGEILSAFKIQQVPWVPIIVIFPRGLHFRPGKPVISLFRELDLIPGVGGGRGGPRSDVRKLQETREADDRYPDRRSGLDDGDNAA